MNASANGPANGPPGAGAKPERWAFAPGEALDLARRLERGAIAVLPLEACLQYGGPMRRAAAALAARGELRLASSYLGRVARGEIAWDAVHRAELGSFLKRYRAPEIEVGGAAGGGIPREWKTEFPDVAWITGRSESAMSAEERIAAALEAIYPAFRASLARETAIDLALGLAAHDVWRLAAREWEPSRAAGSLLSYLRPKAERERLGVTLAQFELARREWARFECLFHPADAISERARLMSGVAALNPAAATLALETGGGFAKGPVLLAIARQPESDEILETALSWEEAALIDELADAQRLPADELVVRVEAGFRAEARLGGESADFKGALRRLRAAGLIWIGGNDA